MANGFVLVCSSILVFVGWGMDGLTEARDEDIWGFFFVLAERA